MKKVLFFLILIFTINIVGMYYQLYLNYSWFDQILHFSGGFFIAMFFSIYLKAHIFENSKLKNTLIILGVASFIGVTWEFAEYIANLVLSPMIYDAFAIRTYFMGDLNDTVNDLLMDILGAGLFSFALHFLRSRKNH
ncbi:MAG: hypothetical protein UT29_C0001G0019 [Candidatus Yanofskybacteria bacterium GW2011_GWA1_39_13]|uniref:Integral membrane protein n=1 Tax=Yanofskybacteria sp. (strain GW2011_GWA1_39_13) TaxID=1619019 RepID=A0A0G0MEN5_YANXG|nr:MAG: hypothetical protein UT29_C0001G0019 [Candidatus Yanofskybacteria bacterium GW2011_GWA1_39_13]